MKLAVSPPRSLARRLGREYLLIAVVPLLVFAACIVVGGLLGQRHVGELINVAIDRLGVEASNQVEALGRDKVRDKAREVARLVDLYLELNPDVEISDLQRSVNFRRIALQQFGAQGGGDRLAARRPLSRGPAQGICVLSTPSGGPGRAGAARREEA